MAEHEHPDEPAVSPSRRPLRKPGSDGEAGLALEVARLFGISPRALLHRKPAGPDTGADETVSGGEDREGGHAG